MWSENPRDTARRCFKEALICRDPIRRILLLEFAQAWLERASTEEGRELTLAEVMGTTEPPQLSTDHDRKE